LIRPEPHDEPGNHFIILTPNPEFRGKRLGTFFQDGEARVTDVDKAREFDLWYGYEVIVPAGFTDFWVAPKEERPVTAKEWGPDPAIAIAGDKLRSPRKATA
jgi:hypothetical protein